MRHRALTGFLFTLVVAALPLAAGANPDVRSASEPTAPRPTEPFRVLTLNIQLDGQERLPALIDLIRKTQADVVGLQECGSSARPIAEALGFGLVKQDDDRAILSRFPVLGTTPARQGALIMTPGGRAVAVFNAHLYYTPYQPYQLLGIPYQGAPFVSTAADAIAAAESARGKDVREMLADVATVDPRAPMIVMGDFNEPSHLDWTARAARAKRHPLEVAWPSTLAFERAGFTDSWRALHPNEIADPGFTWTPNTSVTDPRDHHDRIDFILARGDRLHATHVDIVGENALHAQIVVSPYPTDHRAVLTTFEIH
ncbi:MAG: endonuclease/exonuclease/phosphatase family protein [Proteobacteria bacterium]|nr:endonuclease/exonuclease/phosphatase family protein [Pseudomonadota bacterium]